MPRSECGPRRNNGAPGDVHIDVSNAPWAVQALDNPSDNTVVIVAIKSNTSTEPVSLFVSGTSGRAASPPRVTSGSDNLVSHAPFSLSGSCFSATLAAQNVTTFVGAP